MNEFGPERIFPSVPPLPRGPHRLDRLQVANSQRERLRAAVIALVAQHGYAAVTITAITKHAKVSPNAFYDHFADKAECYVDAYESFARAVADHLSRASGNTIEELVVSMVGEYLGLLDREREAACAVMIEIDGAGPRLRERRRAAYDLAATVIEQRYESMRQIDSDLPVITRRTFLAVLTAVHGLAADALDTGQPTHLTDLIPETRHWITALIAGHGWEDPPTGRR